MIRRLYRSLPGAPALRVAILVVLAAAMLALLVAAYELLGRALLDSGGTIG